MVNLVRYSPVDEAFDNFFRGIFLRPVELEGRTEMQIRTDIKENDKAYIVRAEIPGVKKEDISVTIDGNLVAISAEVKDEKEVKEEGEKVLRRERYYGKVARTFTLGQDVDENAAQAKYSDGVLELVLTKKAATQSRRLTIN